jgi:DGQHR domain-containing protein
MGNYSVNEELRNFAHNIGFDPYIFDDDINIGPEIKLRERSKNGEVDAVLLYKNIVCLVGNNKGSSSNVDKEARKFFEKLDKINRVDKLNLEIEVTKSSGKKIRRREQNAHDMLNDVKSHISKTSRSYDMIFIKLFFCPHKIFDKKGRLEEGEYIVDKDTFDYFMEVFGRLGKKFLYNDIMYFLGIQKVSLEFKKGKVKKPGKSSPYSASRLELEKDKTILYSSSLRVEDILPYVTVLRIAQKYNKKGFQRMIKDGRLRKINTNYLSKNETFPNNIIFALNPEIYQKETDFYAKRDKELTFLEEFNSLIIIDGQHRFFSFVKGSKTDRQILVTFVFFKHENKDDSYLAMDKMFYKINKTQENIDPNLTFTLKARIEPESVENLWKKVFERLLKKGFFAGRFTFRESTLRRGEPRKRSILSVITYGGVLRLNQTHQTKGVEVEGLETFYGTSRGRGVDFCFNLVKNYFDIIEIILHKQGVNKVDLLPREIGALIRLLRHFMITNKKMIEKLIKNKDITKLRKKDTKDA